MNRTFSLLIVAAALIGVPLAGCGENNEKTAGITGTPKTFEPGEDTSPQGQKKQMSGVSGGKKSAGAGTNYPGPKR